MKRGDITTTIGILRRIPPLNIFQPWGKSFCPTLTLLNDLLTYRCTFVRIIPWGFKDTSSVHRQNTGISCVRWRTHVKKRGPSFTCFIVLYDAYKCTHSQRAWCLHWQMCRLLVNAFQRWETLCGISYRWRPMVCNVNVPSSKGASYF